MEDYKYILIEIGLCLIISFVLVFFYSRRGTNPLALLTAGITWCLNFILVIFIPYDIYYTYSGKNNENEIENYLLDLLYKIIYWFLFVCSWIFIPLMQHIQ